MSNSSNFKQLEIKVNPNKNQRYIKDADRYSKGLTLKEETKLDYIIVEAEEKLNEVERKNLYNQITLEEYLDSLVSLPMEEKSKERVRF